MTFKVFVTKYAITNGILELDVTRASDKAAAEKGFVFYQPPNGLFQMFKLGKDAWLTKDEAKAAAEQVCIKKIKSLKKQLLKIERLLFKEYA